MGLSTRLMVLTLLLALITAILIYVPSVANFRTAWLSDRVAQARAAALILDKAPVDSLPKPLVDELLASIDTSMIALRIEQSRRLLAMTDMPPMVDFEVDLRTRSFDSAILNTFDILLFGGDRAVRVVGPAPEGGEFVEIVIGERSLRDAILKYSLATLTLSLAIAAIAAFVVFAVLSALIVGPVKNLASAIMRFRENPEDARTILRQSGRGDEIGTLEREIGVMQASLQQQLRQREHLANLGLAVTKINHDLRNMLAAAQLMADRLGSIADPNVQRFLPRLMDALDRAINFCKSTLAYAKAQEAPPEMRVFDLSGFVQEIGEQFGLGRHSSPAYHCQIPPDLMVRADPGHLARVLTNLVRNAKAVLDAQEPDGARNATIRIEARQRDSAIEVDVVDSGPGVPQKLRGTLFRPFSSTSQNGSTGLGLAIARELMRSMGGDLMLVESAPKSNAGAAAFAGLDPPEGARFRLLLPRA